MPFDTGTIIEECGLPKIEPIAPFPPKIRKIVDAISRQDKAVRLELERFFKHGSGVEKDLVRKALVRYSQFKQGKNVKFDDLIKDFLKRKLDPDLVRKMLPLYKKRFLDGPEWQMVQTLLLRKKLMKAIKDHEAAGKKAAKGKK